MRRSSIVKVLFFFLLIFSPSFVKSTENHRSGWTALEYISNGETVHLEMPANSQVLQQGPLISVVSTIGNIQYSVCTTNPPRAGVSVDQAISMVSAIIQNNGGYVQGLCTGQKMIS